MASHKSVLHVQRGFRMSKSYAEQVMRDHCTIAWVIKGETIRDTTEEERLALRVQQAQQEKLRQPLAYAEIPGIVFRPPVGSEKTYSASSTLVWEAHRFVTESAAA